MVDPSRFVYQHDGHTIIILLNVDDIIITNDLLPHIDKLVAYLESLAFSLKDLGPLHHFLESNQTSVI